MKNHAGDLRNRWQLCAGDGALVIERWCDAGVTGVREDTGVSGYKLGNGFSAVTKV